MLIFGLLVNQALACSFFTCKDSSKVIPADFVNDNFCDCKDGSDEPNTSACPNNFFKCPGLKIPSSKVQDSVCDCCDGSDETLIACPNICQAYFNKVKSERKSLFSNWQKGLKLRLNQYFQSYSQLKHEDEHLKRFKEMVQKSEENLIYLNAVEIVSIENQLTLKDLQSSIKLAEDIKKSAEDEVARIESLKQLDFGVNMQFYPMFQNKISKQIGKYEYTISFYEKATQKADKKQVNLGSWAGFDKNYTIVHFTNGTPCQSNLKRSLSLTLTCSFTTDLLTITEVSLCTYEGILTLPWACNHPFNITQF